MSRTYAAKAIGWRRGYKSKSPRWEDKSVATLYKTTDENSEVLGTAVLLKPSEIAKLDVFERAPEWYDRCPMTLTAYRIGDEKKIEEF